ncbi:type IV secretion protein DotU [Vibrio kanaloae]|uniref:DotU family type IV/VI secretion system protein n=1 Tax=Vibrio kanaloae TaxID=170673 RepID=A0A2N7J6Z4_9VIBR|nr:type IVB secretion system protein IcmH/DotU [Vibrio kanaloae]PMM00857.1 type IV secretion protein DotU [Vibrio kanaloae]TKE89849.1 DotU family type IV/VI secretion system protein [Vibrio kanaloae]TKF12683.1 DotU family type IV/VI secretion system protein [Vibrio kanaloae]TKF25150.1 DotU family type IV/VI secretion system protein [Vibrio kanaloae]TKF75069.1 DotU family type IV/VI secretion system protein [Vibrio kanaloae]
MNTVKKTGKYSQLLFDDVERINHDQDHWFQLRGNLHNPLIDAATPLLGLALRARQLTECDNIEAIYKQTIEEIKTIELELTELGYEHALLMAYRYILCSFLDESIMGTSWGASTMWAEHSMLSRFHNETWGGEKVFTILKRIEGEPEHYKPLLEFIYQCLVLGFEGKYRVIESGTLEREKVINQLYKLLNNEHEKNVTHLTTNTEHVAHSQFTLSKQIPLWSIFASFVVLWVGVFFGYSYLLHVKTNDVIEQLNQIL